jgi:CheY-like chemotaxis protein
MDSLTVLIVEDNRDARTTMRMLLTLAHGHTVMEAEMGTEGVKMALDAAPDVALIDLGLPDLDGCEVARRIRASAGEDITLIALTGYAADADKDRAFTAGFDHYLVKPVEPNALFEILGGIARAKQGAAS